MKKFFIFLGLTAFMLITIFALGSCNSSKTQPNNPPLAEEPQYINGTLSVYDYAHSTFTDSKGNDTDFLKLIVGKEYTFNLEIDNGYVCEFVRFNNEDIPVPYTFSAPEECHIEFAIKVDTNNDLTIQPSPPNLVGWNIKVTAFGSDCSVQVDSLDCLEHSPCLVEDCINSRVLSSDTFTLSNNVQQHISLASGTVDDLYSARLTFNIPEGYMLNHFNIGDYTGTSWRTTSELPIITDNDACYFIEIYLMEK